MKMIGRRIVAQLRTAGPDMTRDLAGLAGAGLVSYGAWLAWEPAGFLTGGALLMIGAYISARARS